MFFFPFFFFRRCVGARGRAHRVHAALQGVFPGRHGRHVRPGHVQGRVGGQEGPDGPQHQQTQQGGKNGHVKKIGPSEKKRTK